MREYALYYFEMKSLLDDMVVDMREKFEGKICKFHYGMYDVYEGRILSISNPNNQRIELKVKVLDGGYTVYLDAVNDRYEIL